MNQKRILDLLINNVINFIVFCIPVVFFQPSLDPFGPPQMMVARVFLPLLLILYIIRSMRNGRLSFKNHTVLLPLAGYLLAVFASVLMSVNKEISMKYFLELAVMVLGAYIVYDISGISGIKRVVFMIVLSHTLMAAYGIAQHFDADPFKWSTNFAGRALGTIGNPDFLAGELLLSFFIVLSHFFFEKKFRVLAGVSLFIHVLCIYYPRVAGAFIGMALGSLSFSIFAAIIKRDFLWQLIMKNRKKMIAGIFIIVAALIVITPVASSKYKSFVNEKGRSLKHRLIMWESSLLMVRESPVLGKGIGSFRMNYPYYQGILLNDPKNYGYDYVVTWMPHEQYLLIASESGILGLGLFLLAIFVFYRVTAGLIREKRADFKAVGFASSVTALLGASFFNTFYNIPATTFIFFLMLFSQQLFALNRTAYVLKKDIAAPLLISACIALLFLINGDGRTLAANMYLKKAESYSKRDLMPQAIEYYERVIGLKAVELCPQTDVAQYYYAAEAYRKTGNLAKAEQYYRMDLKLKPFCPEVNNMLGAVSGKLGSLDESIKRLEMSIFAAPHYDAAYTNLATAYVAKKDYEGARRTLNKFMEKNGAKPEFENLLKAVEALDRTGK